MSEEKPCIFCDRKNFKERLIGESDPFYFIATLGQISDGGYTLLVPKKHVPCIAEVNFLQTSLVWYSDRICEAIMREYNVPQVTIFEHGIVGQTIKHAHLHFIPAVLNLTKRARTDFPNTRLDIVPTIYKLSQIYPQNFLPYLLWKDLDDMTKICWDPPAPPQYFRKVVAELMNRPERANWREMDPELDKRFWSETVSRLKKYLDFKKLVK